MDVNDLNTFATLFLDTFDPSRREEIQDKINKEVTYFEEHNVKDTYGNAVCMNLFKARLLYMTVESFDLNQAKFLLDHDEKPGLFDACNFLRPDFVDLFLRHGANPNEMFYLSNGTDYGNALKVAFRNHNHLTEEGDILKNDEIIRLLLDAKAEVKNNKMDCSKEYQLFLLRQTTMEKFIDDDVRKIIQHLATCVHNLTVENQKLDKRLARIEDWRKST